MGRLMIGLSTAVMGCALWGLGGVDLTIGTAHAGPGPSPRLGWCPGQKWPFLTPAQPGFDMSICHPNMAAESHRDGTFTIVDLPPPPPPRMCGPVPCALFP
jgi:hypothetical protein